MDSNDPFLIEIQVQPTAICSPNNAEIWRDVNVRIQSGALAKTLLRHFSPIMHTLCEAEKESSSYFCSSCSIDICFASVRHERIISVTCDVKCKLKFWIKWRVGGCEKNCKPKFTQSIIFTTSLTVH